MRALATLLYYRNSSLDGRQKLPTNPLSRRIISPLTSRIPGSIMASHIPYTDKVTIEPENYEVIENAAIEDLFRHLYAAKQPLIIVDGFAPR